MRTLLFLLLSATYVVAQTGNIFVDENHNGHKIYGLPTPAASNEAATKDYVDTHAGGGGEVPLTFSQSLLRTVNDVTLLNDASPVAGARYFYGTDTAGSKGWQPFLTGATGGGIQNFVDLADVPNSYSGQANKAVTVKGTEDGLQFTTLSSGAPVGATYITETADGTLTNEFALGSLATGLLKNTTTTGVPTIAVAGTDYDSPTTASKSITKTSNDFALTNDSTTPGNSKYYGTDSGGTRGYFSLPSPGGTPAGSDTQVQRNNVGAFGSITNMTSDGTNVTKLTMGSAIPIQWSTDLGIVRNAAGVAELNNGTSGQWAGLKIGTRDAGTNTVTDGLTLAHQTSSSPANGLGTAILFNIDDSTTPDANAARIAVAWIDKTHGANQNTYMDFQLNRGGSPGSAMRLFREAAGNGALSVGSTTDPGFNGVINAHGGFWVGSAASTAGTILQSTGSVFTASGPTWPTTSSTAGKMVVSDGTNFTTSNTPRIAPRTHSTTSATSWTPNFDSFDEEIQTALGGAVTINAPTYATTNEGEKKILRIKDDGTARAITWNAAYRAGTSVSLPTTTTISKTLYCGFMYNSTDSKWDLMAYTDGY